MKDGKDGFSSLHCLQRSSLDVVSISVTLADSFAEKPCDDLGYRLAQLRKNVKKRSSTFHTMQKYAHVTTFHNFSCHVIS